MDISSDKTYDILKADGETRVKVTEIGDSYREKIRWARFKKKMMSEVVTDRHRKW